MSYSQKSKNASVSFRTFEAVESKIDDLAARIKENQWSWSWNHPMREATSKSGLINQVLAEKLTMEQIRNELQKVESEKALED